MTEERLNQIFANFWRHRIALIGDLFLDRYLYLQPGEPEVSIETNLEAYQIESIINSPGALGTILKNLVALGVEHLFPISVIGKDGYGLDLLEALQQMPVNLDYLHKQPLRLTPTYTKPMRPEAEGYVELNRLDIRSREPLPESLITQLKMQVRALLVKCDGLIVLDQIAQENQGVIHQQVRESICQVAKQQPNKLVIIDSRAHIDQFDAGILKCNLEELRSIQTASLESEAEIKSATENLSQKTGNMVFTSLGERGICTASNGEPAQLCSTKPIKGPVDIVGAGDTATAALTCALLSGATNIEAAQFANVAASISIEQLGTTGVATPKEIVDRFRAWDWLE